MKWKQLQQLVYLVAAELRRSNKCWHCLEYKWIGGENALRHMIFAGTQANRWMASRARQMAWINLALSFVSAKATIARSYCDRSWCVWRVGRCAPRNGSRHEPSYPQEILTSRDMEINMLVEEVKNSSNYSCVSSDGIYVSKPIVDWITVCFNLSSFEHEQDILKTVYEPEGCSLPRHRLAL